MLKLLVELTGCALVVTGLGLMSVPVALIAAGVAVVLVCEKR